MKQLTSTAKMFLFLASMLSLAGVARAWDTLPSRTNDQPGFIFTPSPPDWRDINIYQVFTDRFFDGDPTNNTANPNGTYNPANSSAVHGGDFEGVRQKLDYLRMLGAQAIWISPVARNFWGDYHGYAASDFNQIDPHWGTLQKLRQLVDEAHARGIYVIIDVVQNHMADLATSSDSGYPSFSMDGYTLRWRNADRRHAPPFDNLAYLHNYGNVADWEDPDQVLLGDFMGLDGIRTEHPDVRQSLIRIFQGLIEATDCDGFRVDTARHVEMEFWETFLPAIYTHAASLGKTQFLVYAEAWRYSDGEVGAFTATNRFNSTLYFPMAGTMEGVFFRGQNTSQLTDRYNGLDQYDPRARYQLVSFFDNHDMSRALASDKLNGSWERLKPALAFLYTHLQLPCLYYGTEQGFDGGNDPYNREDMFAGQFEYGPSVGDNFNMTHELFLWVRRLNLLRNACPALTRGAFQQRWQDFSAAGLYVYTRQLDGAQVLVALNTASGSRTALYEGAGPATDWPNGTVLVNLLDPEENLTVGQGVGSGQVTFSVPAYGTKIFVPAAEQPPLPPSVTAQWPLHSATGMSRTLTVSLDFDRAMNRAATEAAFALQPSSPGVFSWTEADRRLLFTPSVPLAANTRHTLSLQASAAATNGQWLGASFESFFATGSSIAYTNPFGPYVMDGVLDDGVPLLAEANGLTLYAQYDPASGALYLAAPRAAGANDRFILLDDLLGDHDAPAGKAGRNAADGPCLVAASNSVVGAWIRATGRATSVQGADGVLEGAINLLEQYGVLPRYLYLALADYGGGDGGALRAGLQVPSSMDDNGNMEADEFLRLDLETGEVVITRPETRRPETVLQPYAMDGVLSSVEQASFRLQGGDAALPLYADFNGRVLYVATWAAAASNDHFLFVTDSLNTTNNPPWAKYTDGKVIGRQHYLADEYDNSFQGWFINNSMDLSHPSAAMPGGFLEGTLDLVQIFGRIPDRLYLAAVPYQTPNNGRLRYLLQTPSRTTNNYTLDAGEYYLLDLTRFDSDGDGLPDLLEDLNRNGLMDPGETGARIADSDGDGLADGEERLAGTSPLDNRSYFAALLDLESDMPPMILRLRWPSTTSALYTVYYADTLAATNPWLPLSDPDLPGSKSNMDFEVTDPDMPRRFYRIGLRPAP